MYTLNLQTMFGGGLWLIPVILAFGAGYSFFTMVKARKSGSKQQLPSGRWIESDEPAKYTSIPGFWFGIILTFGLIAFFLIQISER